MNKVKIHPLADVQSLSIGDNTQVWQFAIILKGATIGIDCNINCHTFIENDVVIGNRVTVKAGVYIWDGIEIADDVFIGPNVTFVNDKYPRSKQYPDAFQKTKINQAVSIGAAATILGGIEIGEFALIAAGSVVTKNVPAYSLVKGNPGKVVGKVDKTGAVIERF
jgi:UDP-2-acetamido-3-amino-2,3-dideoxy-glucuronate N-acetyltransferase